MHCYSAQDPGSGALEIMSELRCVLNLRFARIFRLTILVTSFQSILRPYFYGFWFYDQKMNKLVELV